MQQPLLRTYFSSTSIGTVKKWQHAAATAKKTGGEWVARRSVGAHPIKSFLLPLSFLLLFFYNFFKIEFRPGERAREMNVNYIFSSSSLYTRNFDLFPTHGSKVVQSIAVAWEREAAAAVAWSGSHSCPINSITYIAFTGVRECQKVGQRVRQPHKLPRCI